MFKRKQHHFYFPWVGFASSVLILLLLPFALQNLLGFFLPASATGIAPLFSSQVQYWEKDLVRWSMDNDLDPNLMATIMQIESCGHPTVASNAGAQGLFQVMPFHFEVGEDMLDPDTNAQRSANFIRECMGYAGEDSGLILACYNGGPRVTQMPFHYWPHETQRYYVWGLGIYYDAANNHTQSQTLDNWLGAGGQMLCTRAAYELGMSPSASTIE